MAAIRGSFLWYELLTRNPASAKAFYDTVVGWNIGESSSSPDMDYRMIHRVDGAMTGGVLTLTDDMLSQGAHPCWLGYIGVDDCDAACAAVQSKGGTIHLPPKDVPMAGRIAMVSDCCGASYYLMTPTPPPGGGVSTAFSPKIVGACTWNELACSAPGDAIAFYTELYGWGTPEPMDMGAMGKYQFVEHDGVTVGAIMGKPDGMPVSAWTPYFRVVNVEAAASAAKAAGATIVMDVHEVPGGDFIAVAIDPEGANFGLVGKKG